LRQHALRQWKKDDPEALRARSDWSDKSDWSDWSDKSDEVFANTIICLINQASYLLWKQMQRLEEDFMKEGGFTELLYNTRKIAREKVGKRYANWRFKTPVYYYYGTIDEVVTAHCL
jgi:four helix bundle suffix protein